MITAVQKIALIGPAYPYRGGNALFVTHLYNYLSPHFEVKIFNYKLLYPSFLFPGTTQYDQSKEAERVPSERIVHSINPFNWICAARKIRKYHPDLVVFDWWNPFFGPCHYAISLFLGKSFRKKILFCTENVISHEGRLVDRWLTRIGLKYAAAYLALSAVVEKDLKAIYPNRRVYRSELPVYDCYAGEQPFNRAEERRRLGIAPEEPLLLFFGYVRKYKGLDVLLRALPKTAQSIPNIRLLIVGEFYDRPDEYLNIIRGLGLNDRVRVINQFVPNEEVGRYYTAADVVVLPYREATQSGILNIAYGFDCPVIVTAVGGLTELVDDGVTGIIAEPESPESLADGILRFFRMSETVSFRENVRVKVRQNRFSEIPELFQTILKDMRA